MKLIPGRISKCIFVLAALTALLLQVYAPFAHNPDANFYYSTALRVSEGRFAESIEGAYGPLLSWCMAVPVYFGVSLPSSFRIINFVAFLIFLLGSAGICKRLHLSDGLSALVLGLLTLHISYISVTLITSDLLTASLVVWAIVLLLAPKGLDSKKNLAWIGVLLGLSYYAKPTQFPIGILIALLIGLLGPGLRHFSIKDSIAKICLIAGMHLLISLPWVITLSNHYGRLIFSAQQLIADGTLSLRELSPAVAREQLTPPTGSQLESISLLTRVQRQWDKSIYGITYLYQSTRDLLFSEPACSIFLVCIGLGIILFSRQVVVGGPWNLLCIFTLSHCAAFIAFWGAYYRYYLPAMPGLYILALSAGSWILIFLDKKFAARTHGPSRYIPILAKALALCILFQTVKTTSQSIFSDWKLRDDAFALKLANADELKLETGVLSGNGANPYPGYVAALLKREFGIPLLATDSIETTQAKIAKSRATQVLWCGEIAPGLQKVPTIVELGIFKKKSQLCMLFEVL